MKKIRLNLDERGYDIIVCYDRLHDLGKYLNKTLPGKDAVIVTTSYLKKLLGGKAENSLRKFGFNVSFRTVPEGEKAKSEQYAIRLLNSLSRADHSKKRLFVIALGGGVIGDLAGFAASVYRRGVPYVQVPTTLLSQVDSAIGGKVAIDLKVGKNLVGAFYQPRIVFADIAALKTLPKKEIISGLSEVIKYGIIKSPALFGFIENEWKKILKLEPCTMQHIIGVSCRIKARVVEEDEYDDKGKRIILNLGHTIGHAIEAAAGYGKSYNHGQAIALGTLCSTSVSQSLGLAKPALYKRIERLYRKLGLPVKLRGVSVSDIMSAQEHDKKYIHGKNRFVLPVKLGKTVIREGIPSGIIIDAVNRLK